MPGAAAEWEEAAEKREEAAAAAGGGAATPKLGGTGGFPVLSTVYSAALREAGAPPSAFAAAQGVGEMSPLPAMPPSPSGTAGGSFPSSR